MSDRLTIEKMIYGGDALSRLNGEVIFTPFALSGEVIEAERAASKKSAQRARLVHVIEPSADRVTPLCPVFGRCGGCQYQHADYPAQLRFKRSILAETLRRGAKIEIDESSIRTVAGDPWNYRNRTQFHIENGKIGFREMGSRKLVPTAVCPISSQKINDSLAKLTRMVKDRRWPRFISSLEIFTDETQVQWNVRETTQNVAKHFFDWLADEIPGTVPGALDYRVNDDLFTVSGNAFFQVNRSLVGTITELALGDESGAAAWDLYAGVGLFSLPLARRFQQVTAVESSRAADDLARNAKRAGLVVDSIRQDTEAFLMEAGEAPDFVLADPPRAGLGSIAVSRLLDLAPQKITIVACDPATLARDLAAMKEHYEIARLILVDLFPQTFHIETIVSLTRR